MPTSSVAQRAGQLAQQLRQSEHSSSAVSLETLLAHSGIDNASHNAPLSPPIHFATTYTRPADGNYLAQDSKYTRHDNPTRLLLEQEMTKLELYNDSQNIAQVQNASYSCAFASGMMAVSSIILAHQAPLLVLLPHDLYHGVPSVLQDVFERFHVSSKRVNMQVMESELESLDVSSDIHIIVWIETPSNPQTQITDIQIVSRIVQNNSNFCSRTTVVVDATLAPFQRPLLRGADLVIQSATKYIGGHGDVLCGVVTVNPSTQHELLLSKLRNVQVSVGGVASPMDCWLALRGMRTLAVRWEKQCQSALALAEYLSMQATVSKIHYPGLVSHPNHDVAKKQMNGHFGGVLSVEMKSEAHAMAFAGALQVLARATSLGGTETLIEHRASIEPEGRVVSPPGLLRISLGLEHVDDLIADVRKALEIMVRICEETAITNIIPN